MNEYRNKILEAVDEGLISAETALHAALFWMSESEVKEFAQGSSDFGELFDEDDEDEDE